MTPPIQRFGLSEIYSGLDANVDLVLVHGLSGHPENTWTAQESDTFWPHDLLPKTIPNGVRILTYGYNATVGDQLGGESSSDEIHHHAQTLVQTLFANRSVRTSGLAIPRL